MPLVDYLILLLDFVYSNLKFYAHFESYGGIYDFANSKQSGI